MASSRKQFNSLIRKYLPGLTVFVKGLGLMYSNRSFLKTSGYIRSVREKRPCRSDGSPIPWMNYHMIAFLEERLSSDLSVFEYGSGNSTMFLAPRVGTVTSVECEREWYEYVVTQVPDNVKLILCDPFDSKQYPKIISEGNRKFDIVIVDAEERVACMKQAVPWVTDRGVILLDDAEREHYKEGIDTVLAAGFRKLDFEGLKPNGIRAYRTTVFYRNGNCLGI